MAKLLTLRVDTPLNGAEASRLIRIEHIDQITARIVAAHAPP